MSVFRDADIFIVNMIEGMPQYTICISIPQCHVEYSIACEVRHSAGVVHFLASSRLHHEPLLIAVVACCSLAALVYLLYSSILSDVFCPEPSWIVGKLAIVPQGETRHMRTWSWWPPTHPVITLYTSSSSPASPSVDIHVWQLGSPCGITIQQINT